MQDELTGLNTTKKFIIDVKKKLANSRASEYSLVSIDINSYRYITEAFGQEKSLNIIKALGHHFAKSAPENSVLCRNFNDNFSFLINATFLPILEDIVINMTSVPDEITSLLPDHFKLEFSIGVYEIKDPAENVEVMMDKAETARKALQSVQRCILLQV